MIPVNSFKIKMSLLLGLGTLHIFISGPVAQALDECTTTKKAISNRFPSLTEKMAQPGLELFFSAYDRLREKNNIIGRDLNRFLLELHESLPKNQATARLRVTEIVDHIFGNHIQNQISSESPLRSITQIPALYKHRVFILRHFIENAATTPHICINPRTLQMVHRAWHQRYLNITYTLMTSHIKQFNPIVKRFKAMVKADNIKIVDLSAKKRIEFNYLTPKRHRNRLTYLHTNKEIGYLVQGFYMGSKKILAVDFAKDFSQTVISFSHELVHATNLPAARAQNRITKSMPAFIDIIQKWISPISERNYAKQWAELLTLQFAFETGNLARVKSFLAITKARQQELYQSVFNSANTTQLIFNANGTKQMLKDEAFIDTVMADIVTVGLADEYRAYGLSLALYHRLHYRGAQPLGPAQEKYVQLLLRGDSLFAAEIYENKDINPFPYIHYLLAADLNRLEQKIVKSNRLNQIEMQTQMTTLNQTYDGLQKILNLMQSSYAKATAKFVSELGDEFSTLLKTNPQRQVVPVNSHFSSNTSLPTERFAEPDSFRSPINHFAILTGRVTTAWVVRFQINMHKMQKQLIAANEAIFFLSAGILDFGSLSVAEAKLVGALYEGAEANINYDDFIEDFTLAERTETLPPYLTNFFAKALQYDTTAKNILQNLNGAQFSQNTFLNLIRFQVLKLYHWLDYMIPEYAGSLAGSDSYLDRLKLEHYDQYNLSLRRAQALIKKLSQIPKNNQSNYSQLQLLALVYHNLLSLQTWTKDPRLAPNLPTLPDLNAKIARLGKVMTTTLTLAHPTNTDWMPILDKAYLSISDPLQAWQKRCLKTPWDEYTAEQYPPLTVELALLNKSFNLNVTCIRQQLYLIRLPGDKISNSTVSVISVGTDGLKIPTIKVFSYGPLVEHFPYPGRPINANEILRR